MDNRNTMDNRQMTAQEDEIDLYELWLTLYGYRWLIVSVTAFFMIVSVVYALMATPVYKASAVLMSAKKDQSLSASLGSLGGLASMAGISLGAVGTDEKAGELTLRSRSFSELFINENNLMPVLFAERWDAQKGVWMVGDPLEIPTLQKAAEFFNEEVRELSEDKMTGLLTLSIRWTDPQIAAEWTNQLVGRINQYMRESDQKRSMENIEFLQQQIAQTDLVAVQQAIYKLIEEEQKTLMLSSVSKEYAFKVLDPAYPPLLPEKPKKKLIVAVGTVAGGMLSVFLAFFVHFVRTTKRHKR